MTNSLQQSRCRNLMGGASSYCCCSTAHYELAASLTESTVRSCPFGAVAQVCPTAYAPAATKKTTPGRGARRPTDARERGEEGERK